MRLASTGQSGQAVPRAHRSQAGRMNASGCRAERLSWQQVDLLPSLVRQPLAVEGKVTLDLGYGPITLPVELGPVAF